MTEAERNDLNRRVAEEVIGLSCNSLRKAGGENWLRTLGGLDFAGDEKGRPTAATWDMEEEIARRGLREKYAAILAHNIAGHQSFAERRYWHVAHASAEDRCRAALMTVEEAKT